MINFKIFCKLCVKALKAKYQIEKDKKQSENGPVQSVANHRAVPLSLGGRLRRNDVALHEFSTCRTVAQETCQAVTSLNLRRQNAWHTQNRLTALCPGLPGWAGTRKAKPIWILLKQETVSGSGISWAICKSAPCFRQITMPAPHHSVFYRPDALPAAQPKHLYKRS